MIWVRIWDALVFLFLALPLATGGIWISRPGMKLELTEPLVPAILLGIIGLWLHFGLKKNLEKSQWLRFGLRAWSAWTRWASKTRARRWIAAAVVAAFWAFVSIRRHFLLNSGTFDLAIFTNAIWNLTHGYGYVSAPKQGINLFADHQSPLFWAFAPIFALIPRPETLLVVQALGLALGGVAVIRLAEQYLPKEHWARWAAPLLYWSYFPIRNAIAFDFHPEVLMLPLFLWAIIYFNDRRPFWGSLFFLSALLAKESAPVVGIGIGLAWVLGAAPERTRIFTRKVGLLCVVVATCVLWVDLKWLPARLGTQYAYTSMYSEWGEGIHSVIFAPLTHPILFFGHIFGKARLKFLVFVLAPLGFLPIFGWRGLLASLPALVLLFLSAGDHRVNIGYHYGIEPASGLFWGWLLAIALLSKKKIFGRDATRALALWTLFWAIAGHGRSEIFRLRRMENSAHRHWVSQRLLPCVNPRLSLAASDALVPHLANRHWAQSLDQLDIGKGNPLACVIIDRELSNWPLSDENLRGVGATLTRARYQEVYRCGALGVYQKPGVEDCLVCPVVCP